MKCVYQLIDPISNLPFYIGNKGDLDREQEQ
jgi:hypothetical protein